MSRIRDALASLPGPVFADLLESDDAYLVVVDFPGATAGTTRIDVDDGRIRIEAQREKDVPEGFRYVRENRSLFVDAEFPLPPDATGAEADASMEGGVLELRIPKRTEAAAVSIEVEDA